MFSLLTSHAACLIYGAALGWAATHWTAVKTAEATAQKVFAGLLPKKAPPAA